jgi:hypothetical protein
MTLAGARRAMEVQNLGRLIVALIFSSGQALARRTPAVMASLIKATAVWGCGVLILRSHSARQTVPRTV